MILLPCSMSPLLRSLAFAWLLLLPCDTAWATNTTPAAGVGGAPFPPQLAETNDREIVVIDTVEYPVPPPWAGNKLTVPADTVPHLQQIPKELTFNQTKIYLRNEAIEPLKALAAAAREDNIELLIDSAYRSARYQRTIFRKFLAKGGSFQNIARYVAPPGYSEHMLGTVVDFYPSTWSFAGSAAYRWLRQHAAEYGFSETYYRNNHKNQPWEPWHWKFAPPTENVSAGNQEISFNVYPRKRAAIRKAPLSDAARSLPPDLSSKTKLSLQLVSEQQ